MEFEPNSNKSKEKPAKPAVTGVVKREDKKSKSSGLKKAVDFVAENVEKNDVKGRIVNDILLPMILDMVNTGLAGAFGIEPSRSRRTLDSVVSTVRSSEYWNAGNKKYVDTTGRTVRSAYDFDNPVFPTERSAEDARIYLETCLDRYGKIYVADIVELARDERGNSIIPSSSDYKYGWTSAKDISVIHVSDGWMLRMPRPTALD